MNNFGKTYGYSTGTIDLTTGSMPGAATAKAWSIFFAPAVWGIFLPHRQPDNTNLIEPETTMQVEPAGSSEDAARQNPLPSKALGMVHHLRHTKN